jgi:hypothetical protein
MAEPDDIASRYGTGAGILDPVLAFSPNLTLDEIKRRRAIAGALASRARGFPKTVGEGMTYFGESVADAINDFTLGRAEKAYGAKRDADFPGATVPAATTPRPVAEAPSEDILPPVATAAVAPPPSASMARPSPAPVYKPTMPLAGADPLTVEPASGPASREAIAQVLERRRIAALNGATGTAGGAPAPAGPPVSAPTAAPGTVPDGASFAEEGGPNPPIVTGAIKPMLVADAGTRSGGIGKIPGPFDPRTPGPVGTGETAPGERPEPKLAPETQREQILKAYQRKYRDDPIAVQNAQQQIDALAGERQRDWTIKHEKWKIDYANDLKQNDPKYQQELKDARTKEQREAEEYATFPFGKARHEQLAKESAELVKGIPAGQQAIANVRGLMNSDAGMFTGSDANISQGLAKAAIALNLPYDPKTRDKVENTEAFKGFITPILASLRPAVVGTGAQTAPELKLLQDAAAGNITLERGSIEKILNAIEHLNAVAAVQHHKRLITNAGGNENARAVLFGNYELPLEDILPRGKTDLLRREIAAKGGDEAAIKAEMEEFDKTYFTPGLAQRVLGRR